MPEHATHSENTEVTKFDFSKAAMLCRGKEEGSRSSMSDRDNPIPSHLGFIILMKTATTTIFVADYESSQSNIWPYGVMTVLKEASRQVPKPTLRGRESV